jgi:hypothetical protein
MKNTLLQKELVLAENAIRLILAAKRNLETQHFLEALQMGSEWERPISADTLMEMCQNLVELDTESNIFRFAHLSVREYFEEKEGFRTRDANTFVLNSCIESWKSRLSENMPWRTGFSIAKPLGLMVLQSHSEARSKASSTTKVNHLGPLSCG